MLKLRLFLATFVVVLGGIRPSDSLAQGYTIKKDVILKGGTPYAKIAGTAGMSKPANLLISALNGDSLFTMKGWNYPSVNPIYEVYEGLEVHFIASGNTLIKTGNVLAGKEKVLQFLLKDFFGNLIVDNKIDPAAEQQLFRSVDNTAKLQSMIEGDSATRAYLKTKHKPMGDESKVITQKTMREQKHPRLGALSPGVTQEIEIYQDGRILALLTKETNDLTSYSSSTYTFSIYPEEPIDLKDGSRATQAIVATVVVYHGVPSLGDIYINRDDYVKKTYKFTNPSTATAAEMELVSFLIKSRYL